MRTQGWIERESRACPLRITHRARRCPATSLQSRRVWGLGVIMNHRCSWISVGLSLAVFCSSGALAWGTYGHEQIADAAVSELTGSAGKWLDASRDAVVRLSITPDCEWKAERGCELPSDPELRKLVKEADAYEHPLHYFEPDAFVKNGAVTVATATALPSGVFLAGVNEYVRRLAANLEYVKLFPHSRPITASGPKPIDVAENGTAPWRVRQLAELAVQALRANRDNVAMVYLGALGHYVGDLSQPFHVTMNYDGQVHEPSAKGIHAAYESAGLERLAREAGAVKDSSTKLWSQFKATEAGVRRSARAAAATFSSLRRLDDIVMALLKLSGDSYAGVAPLMRAYAANSDLSAFYRASLGGGRTVRTLTEARLGVGAAALAAVWRVVFAESGRVGTAAVKFDARTAIENYPKPTYLPKEVLDEWASRGNARGVAAVDACEE